MITINYDPATQIPPIKESDIHKVIISILEPHFQPLWIWRAIKKNDKVFTWYGGNISGAGIRTCSNNSESLIDLLIFDYNNCYEHPTFIVLENTQEVESFITSIEHKYNCKITNRDLLALLRK
jgi:hypothetical protein